MKINIYDTDKKYNIIYADPPWNYKDKVSCGRRGACFKYNTMQLSDIENIPVKNISDENCVLFMWVTMPQLPASFGLIKSWGFKYKTCAFCWIKQNKKRIRFSWEWGTGQGQMRNYV